MSETGPLYTTTSTTAEEPGIIMAELRLKAYAKLINHIMAACAALYELVTAEKAPRWRDIIRH